MLIRAKEHSSGGQSNSVHSSGMILAEASAGTKTENQNFKLDPSNKVPIHQSAVHGEYYGDYLCLSKILNAQHPRSRRANAYHQETKNNKTTPST